MVTLYVDQLLIYSKSSLTKIILRQIVFVSKTFGIIYLPPVRQETSLTPKFFLKPPLKNYPLITNLTIFPPPIPNNQKISHAFILLSHM